jgi:hypothetical protein
VRDGVQRARGVECYERLKTKNGGATTVEPLSTGIAYGLFERVAQDKIPMTTNGYGLGSSADGACSTGCSRSAPRTGTRRRR